MKKYPKLKYPNDDKSAGVFAKGDIVIQEKLDGGNFRFMLERNLEKDYWTKHRDIVFGSRNVAYKNPRDESKQFGRQIDYIREQVDTQYLHDLEKMHDSGLVFFGEAMEPHTLDYDWNNTPAFIGFDVWHIEDERWLHYTDMKRAFEHIDLEIVPMLDIVTAEAWDEYSVEVQQSKFGDVEAEGLTFKNYDTQTFSKFVREDFKEKNKKRFGKSKKNQSTGAEKLSYQYITNARIEKNAHKLVDEGPFDSLKMEMMAPKGDSRGLANEVIADMAEEEAVNIFCDERWEVDIGRFRSITASRCAEVLKQMVQKQATKELQ